MTRKLILFAVLVLALGAISGGIAIAAGGGAGPQAETPAGAQNGEDDDGGKAERDSAGQAENESGEADNESGEADNETGGAGESDDADESLTGSAANSARDAALAATGGGTVTSVERDDGDAGYEVEVRKADGSEAEVQLDKAFKLRTSSGDDD